ncbi:hypothetical protein [Microbacterium gorillae]|uniref:hypothetical protein n=1 Tax=Microbacterium gorillae TaxID=1231063 RepID=UPI0005912398|nr:hypothetical protein [Microbacterium gorillae]
MRSRLIGSLLLVAAVGLVAGCAPQASTPPPTTSPSASADAQEPEPAPTATPAAAEVPFDGDCSQLLSVDDLVDLLGEGTQAVGSDRSSPQAVLYQAQLHASGGMSCQWSGIGGTISVSVLPSAIVPEAVVAENDTVTCGPDQTCDAAVTAGENWLSVSAPTEDAVKSLLANVGARLIDAGSSRAAEYPPGSWALPSCAEVATRAAAAAGWTDPTEGYPSDVNPSGHVNAVLTAHGALGYCGLGADGKAARVVVMPGFAAAELPDLGLEPMEVPGADAAYLTEGEAGPGVYATEGDNTVLVTGSSSVTTAELTDIAAAMIRDATPRPTPSPEEGE